MGGLADAIRDGLIGTSGASQCGKGAMLEVYTGRRGSTVTVADPAAAAARYQGDLMEGGTGWFGLCHADGAITLVPTGLVPLTFETEGNVVLESVGPTQESHDESQ
jgi:hypothetical protein